MQVSGTFAFFIVGPTCSGKSATAQWIAERRGLDILSADSMLVYKGMDIGTAKPGPDERSKVRYWGIDLVDVREPFSVGDYREAALKAMGHSVSTGRKMIVAGGTGLYIRALVDGLAANAPASAVIRSKAELLLREQGVEALASWLKAESRELYDLLPDKKNPRRLVRALERSRARDMPGRSVWRRAEAGPLVPGLKFPTDHLARRIEKRSREMFANGLLEEVEKLLALGLADAPTARQAIGYAEAIACVKGECSVDEALAKTIVRTRRLAKRQNTWFRLQANVRWLNCDEAMSVADIAQMVETFWRLTGPTPLAGDNNARRGIMEVQ